MTEFRYLDFFEKISLVLIIFYFVLSFPSVPLFSDLEGLKLYLDPNEYLHPLFWNFLSTHFLPFQGVADLYRHGVLVGLYLLGSSSFFLSFYCVMRYIFPRRIAILGVLVIITSSTYPSILDKNVSASLLTTFPMLWLWTTLWGMKSVSYRIGLFLGLVNSWGVMVNKNYIFLTFVQIIFLFFFVHKSKTNWFKFQFLKYFLLGIIIIFLLLLSSSYYYQIEPTSFDFSIVWYTLNQKSFLILSVLGLISVIHLLSPYRLKFFEVYYINKKYLLVLLFLVLIQTMIGLVFDANYLHDFSLLWVPTFLALLPIGWIMQTIGHLKLLRGRVFLCYIMVALLDSHLEGRIKTFISSLL